MKPRRLFPHRALQIALAIGLFVLLSTTESRAKTRWVNDPDHFRRSGLAMHSDTPVEVLIELAENDEDEGIQWSARRNLWSRKHLPRECLLRMANSPNAKLREHVAGRPDAPLDLLTQLAQDPDKSVRGKVIRNPNSSEELLYTMILNAPELHLGGAFWLGRPNTSERIVRAVFARPDITPFGCLKLAEDPVTPGDILLQLAGQEDRSVRMAIVKRDSLPEAVIRQLLEAGDASIDEKIAYRYDGPEWLIRQLTRQPSPKVRRVVAGKRALPLDNMTELAQDPEMEVRRAIAFNEATPSEILYQLIEDPDANVRVGLALNGKCPPSIMEALAQDPSVKVRKILASHESLTDPVRRILAEDPDSSVIDRLFSEELEAIRTTRDPETIDQFCRHWAAAIRAKAVREFYAPPETIARLAHDPDVRVRVSLAGRYDLAPDVMDTLIRDEDPRVRGTLAQHRNLGDTLRQQLCDDPDPQVANAARLYIRKAQASRKLAAQRARIDREIAWDAHRQLREAAASNAAMRQFILEVFDADNIEEICARITDQASAEAALNKLSAALEELGL